MEKIASTSTILDNKTLSRISSSQYLMILLQLLGLSWIILSLNVEKDLGLSYLFPYFTCVFAIYALLPIKYRLSLFLLSFVIALYMVLDIWNASVLLIISGILIGISLLRIKNWFKYMIIGGIAIALGLARIGYLPFPLSFHGLRILASIFMFRLILYLYEIRHEKQPVSLSQRISYFFLLPNVIFPLFPIVDYKSFYKKYYDIEAATIYQKGINLIVWGIICLLVYRWIYFYGVPNIENIKGVAGVITYHIMTYLTVIRLIGILSICVGSLRLFGFNLPEIFNNMFLAHSFSDFFRRINIYWKNFLIKVFYYPIYFKVRKFAKTYATLITTFLTFLWTWFFHVYQWAWILGENPIRETGVVYWGTFAVLATLSSHLESKRQPDFKKFSQCLSRSAKVLLVFFSMSLLYTMWTQPTLRAWLEILMLGQGQAFSSYIMFFIALIALAIVGGVLIWTSHNTFIKNHLTLTTHQYGLISTCLIATTLIFSSTLTSNSALQSFIADDQLNANEEEQEYLGYYDGILKADVSSKLWDNSQQISLAQKADNLKAMASDFFKVLKKKSKPKILNKNINNWLDKPYLVRENHVLRGRLKENYKSTQDGKAFSTNQWAMRDKEYSKNKPENTIRIAVLGGSPTMGVGVADEQVFEQVLEDSLNLQFSGSPKIEILNFAMEGVRIYQQLYIFKEKVLAFDIDYVLIVEHYQPVYYQTHYIANHVAEDKVLYPLLDDMLASSGFNVYKPMTLPDKILLGREIVQWSYENILLLCDQSNIQPIVCLLPGKFRSRKTEAIEHQRIFDKINIDPINIQDIYENQDIDLLRGDSNSSYPNEVAHKLIAQRLYNPLLERLNIQDGH